MSWDGSVAPQKPLLPKALREAATWEVAAGAAAAFLEETTGFELERLSRVPYLCIARRRPGDLFDALDDALFVLRRAPGPGGASPADVAS